MKLRKFLLVTTNLVTISAVTAVSCNAKQPDKRVFRIQNVSAITVTQTSAEFTAKITGLQANDQLNVKINDTTHNFTVSSLNKPADNEYKITITGLTKGTTYLLDTIKVNNDTLFNVKRPFTTLTDVVATNPPIENREQEEPANPNLPREENEPSNPGTSDPAPKDPTNGTQQPPKTEPKETSTGNDAQEPSKVEPNPTPVPKDPTTEPGNSDNTQETPREENTPSNPGANDPSPKEPATKEPETGVKQPDEEKPNNGTDNGSSGADDSRDNAQPGHYSAPNQPVEKPIQGNDDQETDTGTITKEEDTKSQPTDNPESTNRNQPSDQKTTETPGQDPSSSTDGDTSKDNSNSAKEEEPIPPRNSAIGGQDSTKTEVADSKNSENDGSTDSNVQDSQQQDAQNPGSVASTEGTSTTPGTENNGTSGNSETTNEESTSTAQGSSDAGSTSETPPAQERKFDSVTIKVDSSADSYVLFEIVSDKSMYDNEVRRKWWTAYIIKGDEGSNSEVYKDKANAWAPTHTDKKISEQNGKVTFQLSTTTPWTAGRNDFSGTFTLIGLYKDGDNHNFLNKPLTFKTSKGKVEIITQ